MSNKEIVQKALAQLRTESPERKFKQAVDLVFILKDLDLKKPEEQVDFYFKLPNGTPKSRKICALVGPELIEDARKIFDKAFVQQEFEKLGKKEIKKMAEEYDYFVAQANVMPKVAAVFGRILGPRGKMPNPKAGCVVAPKSNIQPVFDNLKQTIRVKTRASLALQVVAGSSDMSDDKLVENMVAIYDQVIHHLPKETNNLKTMSVKFTMSKPVKVI